MSKIIANIDKKKKKCYYIVLSGSLAFIHTGEPVGRPMASGDYFKGDNKKMQIAVCEECSPIPYKFRYGRSSRNYYVQVKLEDQENLPTLQAQLEKMGFFQRYKDGVCFYSKPSNERSEQVKIAREAGKKFGVEISE